MLYRINERMLVASVLRNLDFSEQRKNESDKKYFRRIKEAEEIYDNAVQKCKSLGWKTWLRVMKQSEESMCKYFTNHINPRTPFTQLMVEEN